MRRSILKTSLYLFLMPFLFLSCGGKYKLPIGSTCDSADECESGACLNQVCVDPSDYPDTSGDGSEDALHVIDSFIPPDVPLEEVDEDSVEANSCEDDPGAFLCECTNNSDCNDGYCVPTSSGTKVCTKHCREDCPDNWTCESILFPSGDATFLCLQKNLNLCRPCTSDSQCQDGVMGDSGSRCVLHSPEEGAFCGVGCLRAEDCPSGFACEDVETLHDGDLVKQCVPMAGLDCECSPRAILQSAGTSCVEDGCVGRRICEEDGLSDCQFEEDEWERCQAALVIPPPVLDESIPGSPSPNQEPEITGTGALGTTVVLFDNPECEGLPLGAGEVSETGSFSITIQVPDNEVIEIYAHAERSEDDYSECTEDAFSYEHDDIAPAAPVLVGSFPASPTNVTTAVQLFGEVSEPELLVSIFDNELCEGPPLNSEIALDGVFDVDVVALPNSTTIFFASASDLAGNVSPCSVGFPFVHHDEIPDAPVIVSSTPASPSRTSTEPILHGTASISSGRVQIFTNNQCQGSLHGEGDLIEGEFSLAVEVDENSETLFYANVFDELGNLSGCSRDGFSYVHDSIPPSVPLLEVSPESPSSTASISLSAHTDDGSLVHLYLNAACEGSAFANQNAEGGRASFFLSVEQNDETVFYARAEDAAGNLSECSLPLSYVHDDEPPLAPVLESSPVSPSNDAQPDIIVRTEANVTIELYRNANCSGSPELTEGSTGTRTAFRVSVEKNASTHFSARLIDLAGNVSPCGDALTYVHSNQVPDAPILSSTPLPPSSNENPVLSVLAAAGDALSLFESSNCSGEVLSEGVADSSGLWEVSVHVGANETKTFTAKSKDAAGNISGCSSAFLYENDSLPPEAPILSVSPESPSNVENPSISASAEKDSMVRIYKDSHCSGEVLLEGIARSSGTVLGHFTETVSLELNARNEFYATATDAAGNISSCTGPLVYVHDSVKPEAPLLSINPESPSSDSQPRLTVSSAEGMHVEVFLNSACLVEAKFEGVTNGSGVWSQSVSVEKNVTTAFYARVTSPAGNTSNCAGPLSYTNDTIPPQRPTLSANPTSPSSQTRTTVRVDTEEDAEVYIYRDEACSNTAIASGDAGGDGRFEKELGVDVDATTLFFADAVDVAGNRSLCAGPLRFVNDSMPPVIDGFSVNPASPSKERDVTLSVQTEGDATLRLYQDAACEGNAVKTGEASATGHFEASLRVDADRETLFYVEALDEVGNLSPCKGPLSYRNDSTPPSISQMETQPASPANSVSPKFSLKTEGSASVRVFLNAACTGTPESEAKASSSGNFSVTLSVERDATTKIYADAEDALGNRSECQGPLLYVNDSTAPPQPGLSISPDSPSNVLEPTLTVTTEPGIEVNIYIGRPCTGEVALSGTSESDGRFVVDALVEKDKITNFYVNAVNSLGNVTDCAGPFSYENDSTAPERPTVSVVPSSPSSDPSPRVSVKAEKGATVRLFMNQTCAGSGLIDEGVIGADGVFTATVEVDRNKVSSFYADAMDEAGNRSVCSLAATYEHDDVAPGRPSLSSTPASPSNEARPVIAVKTEAGAVVGLYVDRACTGDAAFNGEADHDGNYEIMVTVPGNRTTSFYANATDAAGNSSDCSLLLDYEHDAVAPEMPVLFSNPVSPSSSREPEITVKTEAGAAVALYVGRKCTGEVAYEGRADRDGVYSVKPVVAGDAVTDFYASATDDAGNRSVCSEVLRYEHDGTPPMVPILSVTPGSPSADSRPLVTAKTEGLATVRLFLNAACTGSPAHQGKAGNNGNYSVSVTVPTNQTTGFYADATDAAGNRSACSPVEAYEHDAVAPGRPVLSVNPSSPSSDPRPQVSVTSERGAHIRLFLGSACTGNAAYDGPANSSGIYVVAATVPTNQTTAIYADATDAAGNRSVCSTALNYRHDNEAPGRPTLTIEPDSPSSEANPRLSIDSERAATVRVYMDNACTGHPAYEGQADADGLYLQFATVPRNQTTAFYADATDAAGNRSDCSVAVSYTHDDEAPEKPRLSIDPSSPSSEKVPVLSVSTESRVLVEVYLGSACSGTPIAAGSSDTDGFYSLSVEVVQNQVNTFYARATDRAGNTSACSSALSYVHDATPPEAPVLSVSPASPSNEIQPVISATGEVKAFLEVFLGDECHGQVVLEGILQGGHFEAGVRVRANETSTFSARLTDEAGNISPCSRNLDYRHDGIAPEAPHVDMSPRSPSSEESPSVLVRTESGAKVLIFEGRECDGALAGEGTADRHGETEITVAVAKNRINTFSARAIDDAGNLSPCSAYIDYEHDDMPPLIIRIETVPESLGNILPVLIVETDEVGLEIEIYRGANCSGSILAEGLTDSDGLFVETVGAIEGTNEYRALARDRAGNVTCSDGWRYIYDVTAPPAPNLTAFNPQTPSTSQATSALGRYTALTDPALIYLYKGDNCQGSPLNPGGSSYDSKGDFAIGFQADANKCTAVSARAVDLAGNQSICSNSLTFGHMGYPQYVDRNSDWFDQRGPGYGTHSGMSTADPEGNVYVAVTGSPELFPGGSTLRDNVSDAYVLKYSPSGDLLWWKRLASDKFDAAKALMYHPGEGGIWVAGDTEGDIEGEAIRRDACAGGPHSVGQCTVPWVALLNKDSGDVRAFRLVNNIDGERRFESVVDITLGTLTEQRGFAAHVLTNSRQPVNGNGVSPRILKVVVRERVDAPITVGEFWSYINDDQNKNPSGLSSDAAGNVYLAGRAQFRLTGEQNGTGNANGGNYVYKLSPEGERIWLSRWGSANHDLAADLTVDGAGNVYATGYVTATPQGEGVIGVYQGRSSGGDWAGDGDVAVVKFDSRGFQQWVSVFGTPVGDMGRSVFAEGDRVHVSGYSRGNMVTQGNASLYGGRDPFYAELDASNGRVLQRRQFGSSGEDYLGYSYFQNRTWYFVGNSNESWLGMHEQMCTLRAQTPSLFMGRFSVLHVL